MPEGIFEEDIHLDSNEWRFGEGAYPYADRMPRKDYERQKADLQVELLKLQQWIRESGKRVIILFEGRDAAGKGGHDQAIHGTSQPAWRPGSWRWIDLPR